MNVYCDTLCLLFPLLHIRFIWLLVFPALNNVWSSNAVKETEHAPLMSYATLIALAFAVAFYQTPQENRRLPEKAVRFMVKNNIYGNVFCPWYWSGYVTWKTDKKCKVFVDTRIEPFTTRQIDLSLHACEFPARYLGELVEYGTEFIVMPVGDRQPEWEMLAEEGLIDLLHKNEHEFVARVNTDKMSEVYTRTHFGTELTVVSSRFNLQRANQGKRFCA